MLYNNSQTLKNYIFFVSNTYSTIKNDGMMILIIVVKYGLNLIILCVTDSSITISLCHFNQKFEMSVSPSLITLHKEEK